MGEQQQGVTITLREIYDAVVNLTGRVERAIDQQSAQAEDVADHEQRLRVLERARWPLASVTALAGVVSLLVAAGVFKP